MSGSDLFTGTLDLLILRTLERVPMHGYGVGRVLRDTSSGALDVAEGVLYPALHRLEEKGWLEASWRRSDSGRRAKYYALTPEGVERLGRSRADWDEFVEAVTAVLDGAGP